MVDIVTIGETMLRFSPPYGETLESASEFKVDPGGAESNVAVALARLGLSTGWISRLPANVLGRRIAGQIRRHGVDLSAVIWAPVEERLGTYYIEPGRTPRQTAVQYDRMHSAFSRIEPGEIAWEYGRQAQWLHLGGITPAPSAGPRRTVAQALDEATESGVSVSFDVNYRSKLWSLEDAATVLSPLLNRATIIQCSLHDAVSLFNMPSDRAAAARALYRQYAPRVVVVTDGDTGASAYDGQEHFAPALQADTLDPVGSGDAFAAGFIAGYLDDGIEQALAWGNAAAALKRTYRGDLLWATRRRILHIPGIFTPSEAQAAFAAGCRTVKLFPAAVQGPEYLQELRAPLDDIDFVPTGA